MAKVTSFYTTDTFHITINVVNTVTIFSEIKTLFYKIKIVYNLCTVVYYYN